MASTDLHSSDPLSPQPGICPPSPIIRVPEAEIYSGHQSMAFDFDEGNLHAMEGSDSSEVSNIADEEDSEDDIIQAPIDSFNDDEMISTPGFDEQAYYQSKDECKGAVQAYAASQGFERGQRIDTILVHLWRRVSLHTRGQFQRCAH